MLFDRKIYIIDWKKLATWMWPVRMRQPITMAVTAGVVNPLNEIYLKFIALKTGAAYELSITPQVCYLQKMLNDRWDSDLRRIRIVKPFISEAVIFYLKSENKKQVLHQKSEGYPLIFYKKTETELFGVDFIVEVPGDVVFDNYEMSARLENKILPSKTFEIKIV